MHVRFIPHECRRVLKRNVEQQPAIWGDEGFQVIQRFEWILNVFQHVMTQHDIERLSCNSGRVIREFNAMCATGLSGNAARIEAHAPGAFHVSQIERGSDAEFKHGIAGADQRLKFPRAASCENVLHEFVADEDVGMIRTVSVSRVDGILRVQFLISHE